MGEEAEFSASLWALMAKEFKEFSIYLFILFIFLWFLDGKTLCLAVCTFVVTVLCRFYFLFFYWGHLIFSPLVHVCFPNKIIFFLKEEEIISFPC